MPLRRILLIVSSLLLSAVSASAECAWVLWAEEQVEMTAHPDSAHETKQTCERAVNEVLDKMHGVKSATVIPQSATVIMKLRKTDGSVMTTATRYVCLPDTVDPRAK